MLTTTARNALAAQAERFMRETCTVARETVTQGVYGEADRQWTQIAADVPCRLVRPQFSRRTLIVPADGRESAQVEYRLVLPLSAVTLQVKDRVTVNGNVLRVTQIPAEWTDLPFQQVQVSSGEATSG